MSVPDEGFLQKSVVRTRLYIYALITEMKASVLYSVIQVRIYIENKMYHSFSEILSI
jgi:hypothetical protein